MGMAASQARFLQLTGRRTNIEYMGQQINQQRLALANQSAGLFERMLTLEPPVPPSSLSDEYYTQGYTFKDGVKNVNGEEVPIYKGDDMSKKVSWSTVEDAISAGTIQGTDTAYSISYTQFSDVDGNTTTQTLDMDYDSLAALSDNEDVTGMDTDLQAFMTSMGMTSDPSAERTVMRYISIEHSIYDPNGDYQIVQEQMPAILEFDNLERLINIQLLSDVQGTANAGITGADESVPGAGDGTAGVGSASALTDFTALNPTSSTEIGKGEELTYSGVFDEVAFNDDMNKYEFQKAAYDYQIERINLETAQIQKQDKSLELKMKQLDTEHRAVQTEMDAVSKVIQKNIESTFKTFA